MNGEKSKAAQKPHKKRIGFKQILSILTFGLVGLILFLARDDLKNAVGHLGEMNIWILLLLIPAQILMYFTAGQIYFAYLKARKPGIKISLWKLMRMSFEINFTNHILPSGGASGLAYVVWRLKEYNITAGQATMMHILRYAIAAMATVLQMLVALFFLGISGALSGWIFWLSVLICVGMAVGIVFILFIVASKKRIDWFGKIATRFINWLGRVIFFWKKGEVVVISQEKLDKFLMDMHQDYTEVRAKPALMIKPFLWGSAYAFIDAMTYFITFLALGIVPNVWAIILAQGIASIVGTIAITPGGAGFYEAVMMSYFVAAGASLESGFIATVVTRVIVLLGTIVFGWGFYQHALLQRKKVSQHETERPTVR